MNIKKFEFNKAVPVWKKGESTVMNQTVDLIASVCSRNATLRLTGSTIYQVFVNGVICAHGPARAAHGYFKVDEIPLDGFLTDGADQLLIRICGYNVNCFAYTDQPSFICAELCENGKITAYTGEECVGFSAYQYVDRITKTQRFSFQRGFGEAYRFGIEDNREAIKLERSVNEMTFINRDVPYPEYNPILPMGVCGRGGVAVADSASAQGWRQIDRAGSDIIKGYKESELECAAHIEYGKLRFSDAVKCNEDAESIILSADSYADVAFESDRCGIIELEIEADEECTLFVAFDELLENGKMDAYRMNTSAFIPYYIKGRVSRRTYTVEPYTLKYIRLIAVGGSITVWGVKQVEYAFPKSLVKAEFISNDSEMRFIYDAAINTFRDNTVDIYMDCPSRERAGWLCDSFFTARVEKLLTGRSDVERAFLYNFLYHEQDKNIPDGMFPMCYPSDHYDGCYIPNWAMWYVLELREYYERTGDTVLINDAKERMYKLLDFFGRYENSDGLLEKLEGWVFVDWSKANELVQDVSYPTNMTYAYILDAIGEIYGDSTLCIKAERIRKTVRKQALTESGFFCDNAVRGEDGKLRLSGECTEACQYYAFFTGTATPESYPELWNRLVNEFGFDRAKKGLYPEIYPANAFIANYVRLESLCKYGENKVLGENIKGYFTYMAERTNTLWENNHDRANLNHGFASCVIYWMEKLGLVKGC